MSAFSWIKQQCALPMCLLYPRRTVNLAQLFFLKFDKLDRGDRITGYIKKTPITGVLYGTV